MKKLKDDSLINFIVAIFIDENNKPLTIKEIWAIYLERYSGQKNIENTKTFLGQTERRIREFTNSKSNYQEKPFIFIREVFNNKVYFSLNYEVFEEYQNLFTFESKLIINSEENLKIFKDNFFAFSENDSETQYIVRNFKAYKRNQKMRNDYVAKRKRCEYCQNKTFIDKFGFPFLEAHHIIFLCNGGADQESNIIALCPNCHREAHYGINKDKLEKDFLRIKRF